MEDFMKDMETKVGQPLTKDDLPDDETPKSIPYEDWDEMEALVMPERDDYDITTYDPYMHADVDNVQKTRLYVNRWRGYIEANRSNSPKYIAKLPFGDGRTR
jgi:hypothetical protein